MMRGANTGSNGNSGGQGASGSGRRNSRGNLCGKYSGVIIVRVGNLDRYGSQ